MGESGITPVTETTQLAAPPPPPHPLTEAKAKAPSRGSSMKIRMKNHEDWLKRNALMIAATVIAAMAYQTGLNPTSRVWQDDTLNTEGEIIYFAGTSIVAFNSPYGYPKFMTCNSVFFVASLSIISAYKWTTMKRRIFMCLLMVTMWVTFVTLTYLTSLLAVSPDHKLGAITRGVVISVLVWLGLIGIVILIHTVRFLIWCVRKVRKFRKKKPSSLP